LGDSTGYLEGYGRGERIRGARAADEEKIAADLGLQKCNWPL
jgi:hypothetical protein